MLPASDVVFLVYIQRFEKAGGADERLLYNGCDSFGFAVFYQNKYGGDSAGVFFM